MTHYKFLLLIFFSILLIFDLSAQRKTEYADVGWGQEYQEPSNSRITNILGTTGDGFYALRLRGSWGRPYIEEYGNDMKLRKSEELSLSYKGKQQELENVIWYNDQLYMITSFNNEQKNTNYLFMEGIFPRTFTKKGDIRVVGEIPARNRNNEGFFDFRVSRDSSKFLIYNEMPYKKNEPERFAFRVFDDKMESLWYKEVVLPYADFLFEVVEFRVDDRGRVFLLGKLYNENRREKKGGKPNYKYVVVEYKDGGESSKTYQVNLQDKFISDLTFRVARNGDLIFAGFFSNRTSYTVKGTCYFKINGETGEVYNSGIKEFGEDFLSQFHKREKKGKELYSYDLKKLIPRSDGGAVLVAEQYFVRVFRYRDYYTGLYEERYYYYYNDIIVANINPDGSIAWVSKIPKRQETSNDGGYFSSFSTSVVRDKLFFIFNDHPKNANEKDPKRLLNFNGKQSVVTLAVLKANGEYDKYGLFSNKDADIITRPKICKQSGKDEMLIYGERNKRYKFGVVKFKDVP